MERAAHKHRVCGRSSQLRPAGCKQPGPHKGVKLCLGDQAQGQAWPSSSRLQPPWSEPAPPRHLAPTPCGLSHENSKCMSKGPCPRQVRPGKMRELQVQGWVWQKPRGRTGRARRSPGQKASSSSAVKGRAPSWQERGDERGGAHYTLGCARHAWPSAEAAGGASPGETGLVKLEEQPHKGRHPPLWLASPCGPQKAVPLLCSGLTI